MAGKVAMSRLALAIALCGVLMGARMSIATALDGDAQTMPAVQVGMPLAKAATLADKPSTAGTPTTDPDEGDFDLFEVTPAAELAGAQRPRPIVRPVRRRVAPPLSISANSRYIIDSNGTPFFMQGDAAWALMAELDRGEVNTYLGARKLAGFNTILVSVIEHRFANGAPNNAYGDPPFRDPDDFSTPNERYFAHVDWVLRRAAEEGFVVLLAPSYLGFEGGDEGWYRAMAANGRETLKEYGRFLGARYSSYRNIIWLNGGDYDPPNQDLVRAIAEGIRETAPSHLQTFGGGPDSSARDHWDGEPWLDLNTVYTYGQVYPEVMRQYRKQPAMPVFLLEAMYENEQGSDERRLRAQAYHALLGGAFGHVFGNNPMWHFDGPGIYPVDTTWQAELSSAGTRSMAYLYVLFSKLRWWRLEPDDGGRLLKGDTGSGLQMDVAAAGAGGAFAIAYTPTGRDLHVDLGRLVGPRIVARWYDPTNGKFLAAQTDRSDAGVVTYSPPGVNSTGYPDWVLILQSRK